AILFCVTTSALAADRDPFQNWFAPPERVNNWMSIEWAGAMNHPIVPVYYFTEQRKAAPLTRYVRLTPVEYRTLVDFTHSVSCSSEIISNRPPYPNTIAIREYSN